MRPNGQWRSFELPCRRCRPESNTSSNFQSIDCWDNKWQGIQTVCTHWCFCWPETQLESACPCSAQWQRLCQWNAWPWIAEQAGDRGALAKLFFENGLVGFQSRCNLYRPACSSGETFINKVKENTVSVNDAPSQSHRGTLLASGFGKWLGSKNGKAKSFRNREKENNTRCRQSTTNLIINSPLGATLKRPSGESDFSFVIAIDVQNKKIPNRLCTLTCCPVSLAVLQSFQVVIQQLLAELTVSLHILR